MSFQSEVRSATGDVGENPRVSAAGQADYRRLRDLRSAARDDERRQETEDARNRKLRVAPQWSEIAQIAAQMLAEVGKDIEVAVWLIEAETRLNGHAGMLKSFTVLTDMVVQHGAMLHPHPEDSDDHPFEMVSSLNGVGREGTLIQPLQLLPLAAGAPFGEACLWSTQTGSEAQTEQAIATAGRDAARGLLADLVDAQKAVRACDGALTDLLGRDAPPFSQIHEILEVQLTVLHRLTDIKDAPQQAGAEEPGTGSPAAEDGTTATSPAIKNREDAFEQLLRIARFFRHAEPHSPIADTLETLVRRGRMDFLTLIEELIPDPNARQAVMTSAGIGKSNPQDTGTG